MAEGLYNCPYCPPEKHRVYPTRTKANKHIQHYHPEKPKIPPKNPVDIAKLAVEQTERDLKHADITPQALGAMLDHAVECKDGVCYYRDELHKRRDQIMPLLRGQNDTENEPKDEPKPEVVTGSSQRRRWGFTD